MSKLLLDFFRTQKAVEPKPVRPTRTDRLRAEREKRFRKPIADPPAEESSEESPAGLEDVVGS